MADGGRDLLYALRNNFHLGAYQAALGEAQDLQHDDLGGAETVERDVFMYRAYIELGQPEVCLTEVTDDSELALQACKLLALVRSDPGKKEEVVAQVTEWLSDPAYSSNLMLCELCGEIYMATESYEEVSEEKDNNTRAPTPPPRHDQPPPPSFFAPGPDRASRLPRLSLSVVHTFWHRPSSAALARVLSSSWRSPSRWPCRSSGRTSPRRCST